MICALSALVALALPGSTEVDSKVIAASLFKNGYAVVVREIPLAGPETTVKNIPNGSLGTVWIYCNTNVKLGEIVNTTILPTTGTKAKSLDDLLALNEGKTVTLTFESSGRAEEYTPSVTGKIVSAEGSVVVLESNGETVAFKKSRIAGVSSKGGGLRWSDASDTDNHRLKIKADGPEGSKAYIVSYEQGATWSPAYSLDISNPKKLRLTAKAVILNDLADFASCNTRLVTGFPNIKFSDNADPLTSTRQADEFVQSLVTTVAPEMRLKGRNITTNFMNSSRPMKDDEQPTVAKPAKGQVEDLFFYSLQNVNLMKGDRGYYSLFSQDCDYVDLYTWGYGDSDQDEEGPDGDSKDVWHCLKFKNPSQTPWTAGPIVTMKDGQMLGQDSIPYTRSNGLAIVRITKALEIQTNHQSVEIERVRGVMKDFFGKPTYDVSTVKETFKVRNLKKETVKVLVHRVIEGKILSSTGKPTINPVVRDLEEMNPSFEVEWIVEVGSGKTVTLTCTRKAFVSVQGD